MLEAAVLNVVQDLDLNDLEKTYVADYFRSIKDRKPALFKKEQVQEKTSSAAVSLPVVN